jgi:hypothetical protein
LARFYAGEGSSKTRVFPAHEEPKSDPTMAQEIDGFAKKFSNRPLIRFDPLFLRTIL